MLVLFNNDATCRRIQNDLDDGPTGNPTVKADPLHAVVDIDRYPIHEPDSQACRDLIAYCRAELDDDGCCSVEQFFRTDMIAQAARMAIDLEPRVHRPTEDSTPYGGKIDDTLSADHPRRIQYRRGGGFICADLLDPDSGLWTFFNDARINRFMELAFDTGSLYQYADPLASMAINSMWAGDEFPWHFDTNEMTVSIMLQSPETGGVFEYVPNIRNPANECYERVRAVFDGDRSGVRQLVLQPGDMQLFQGRYTLHRVTQVGGTRVRHVALPSWSTSPGQVGVVERMIKSYGRALPIHYEKAGLSPDGLAH